MCLFEQKIFRIAFGAAIAVLWLGQHPLSAQTTPDELTEQREFGQENRSDETYEEPKTVKEIYNDLKARAELNLQKKKKKALTKTKISARVSFGYESNPAYDGSNKGDSYEQTDFTVKWTPSFAQAFDGEFGFRSSDRNYFDQESLDTYDQSVFTSFKYYPLKSSEILLEPGFAYDWIYYPNDDASNFTQTRTFLNFTHFIAKKWNYGGRYEFTYRPYNKRLAHDDAFNELSIKRNDYRNTLELWVKRFIGKYTLSLHARSYRNNSNESFQSYYDYDSHRGFITLGGKILDNDRTYFTVSSNFEVRNYEERLAVDTARSDKIIEGQLNTYYSINKDILLNFSFDYRKSNSNAASGDYKDLESRISLIANF